MKKLAIATIYAGLVQTYGKEKPAMRDVVAASIAAYKEIGEQLGSKLDEDEERIFGGSSENSRKSPKEQGPMDFLTAVKVLKREGRGTIYRSLWSPAWSLCLNNGILTSTIGQISLKSEEYLAKDWVWKEA